MLLIAVTNPNVVVMVACSHTITEDGESEHVEFLSLDKDPYESHVEDKSLH